MTKAALAFLVLAIVAALFGFTDLAGTASSLAQILFGVFVIIVVLSLVFGRRSVATCGKVGGNSRRGTKKAT